MKNKDMIIVVDMVNGFVKEGALHDEKIMDIVPTIKAIVERFKSAEITVIQDTHDYASKEFESYPVHCLYDSTESATIDELQYLFDLDNFYKIIAKNSTNGAFALIDDDHINDINRFLIVGCCTDICVLHLALTLKTYFNEYDLDKEVIVIEDGVATFDAPNHDAKKMSDIAFDLMKSAGVKVVKVEHVGGEK